MCFVEFGSYDRPVDPHHYSEHIKSNWQLFSEKKCGYGKKLFYALLIGLHELEYNIIITYCYAVDKEP